MDIKNLKWTREPKDYVVRSDRIEIITQPEQIYGRGRIIISAMTMLPCCRWKQKKNFSHL